MKEKSSDMEVEKKRAGLAFIPPFVLITILWLMFVLSVSGVLGSEIFKLGILPRHPEGLIGIVVAPLIHQSLTHLLSNTFPLLLLMWCLFYFYSPIAFRSFFFMWLLNGLFTWFIGRESYHIGASGLIFSLIFFLFFSGIFRKHIPLIALSLTVVFVYGSMIWLIFPFSEIIDSQISWESHLSGALAGVIMAIVYRKQGPQKPLLDSEDGEEDDADNLFKN